MVDPRGDPLLMPLAIPPSERKALRLRAFVISAALWAFIMALLWYQGTIAGYGPVSAGAVWGLRAFWMLSAFALGWLVYRIFETSVNAARLGAVPVLGILVVLFGAPHTVMNTYAYMWFSGISVPFTDMMIGIVYWLHFQLAWGILILTLVMGAQAKAERAARAAAQREAQGAQLEALRFQVHPHFLFNTLGAVSSLIGEAQFSKAEEMVRKLAAFLRSGLRRDSLDDVTLTEEIADLQVYLDIERTRFEGHFDFVTDVSGDADDAVIPSFLLQPVLENSIKYAVAMSERRVTITLTAARDGDMVELQVCDDGPGVAVSNGTGTSNGLGTGEANVKARLIARFGEHAELGSGRPDTAADDDGRGYCVWMRFPYEPGAGGQ